MIVCHRCLREFDSELRCCWSQEIRFNLIDRHPDFHRTMDDASFSLSVCIEGASELFETLLELCPPHVSALLSSIEQTREAYMLRVHRMDVASPEASLWLYRLPK